MLYNTSIALASARAITDYWQMRLAPHNVQVILAGSLVSGLFVWDDETEVIDVDVKFLVNDEQVLNEHLWERIETITGLAYRKQCPMRNEPDVSFSPGVLLENRFTVGRISIPLEVEGALRNRCYASWAHFYPVVFTPQEMAHILEEKARLKAIMRVTGEKTEYKAYKDTVHQEADRRVIERGLAQAPAVAATA